MKKIEVSTGEIFELIIKVDEFIVSSKKISVKSLSFNTQSGAMEFNIIQHNTDLYKEINETIQKKD